MKSIALSFHLVRCKREEHILAYITTQHLRTMAKGYFMRGIDRLKGLSKDGSSKKKYSPPRREVPQPRERSITLLEQLQFEQGNRSHRRGIVISNCVDQMESMFLEPNKDSDIFIFRVDVHGKF